VRLQGIKVLKAFGFDVNELIQFLSLYVYTFQQYLGVTCVPVKYFHHNPLPLTVSLA